MDVLKHLGNKRGSQMTEAAIALPLVILAAMLMIRMLVFCLDVLTTGIEDHRKALELQDSYNGAFIRTHEEEHRVKLLKGGLLLRDAGKTIRTKVYLINEDILVRSSEILD